MTSELKEDEFDAILLLGNTLSSFLVIDDIKRCLKQLFQKLKPGGILLIDERNFKKITSNKDEIFGKPELFYTKFYSAEYIYCGTDVRGWPEEIEDKKIIFKYARKESPEFGPRIPMYNFKEGEMEKILRNTGFINTRKFSDFKPDLNENADFFIYKTYRPT
jgi:hypothetical protein